jgi:low temperature requirement protein LtrA
VIVLALALPGALWWTYFTDYVAAERALGAVDTVARSLLALRAYYFAHIPVLLRIVVAAAGIHGAVGHPEDPSTWPVASALAGGVALFLAGIAWFRRCMAIGSSRTRLAAALVTLASMPIGALLGAWLHLAVVLAVVVGMLLLSARGRAADAPTEAPS